MWLLIFLLAVSRLTYCSPTYHGVTVGITPYSAPVNAHLPSLYHAQDKYGQYMYGYSSDLSAQDEVKTADGVTRGGYSYIDANGILQTVQYIADDVNGFRVVATNLPRDVPAVAQARAQHLAQFEYIKAEHAYIAERNKQLHQPVAISPVPAVGQYVVPVRAANIAVTSPNVQIAHAASYIPAVEISSQYQEHDGHGQYTYGYADSLSAKSETKTADGVTRGGYSYIDANGILQTVHYVADAVNGFRVAATNLPQAPSVTLIGPKVSATVVGPQVEITPPQPLHINPIVVEDSNYGPIDVPISVSVPIQPEIVQHANIPIASSATQIHINPNHQPPVVYPNPGLSAPFQPQYSELHVPDAPVPLVNHAEGSIYAGSPPQQIAVEQSVPISHQAIQPIAAYTPEQIGSAYNPEQVGHAPQSIPAYITQQQILQQNHAVSQQIPVYAAEQQALSIPILQEEVYPHPQPVPQGPIRVLVEKGYAQNYIHPQQVNYQGGEHQIPLSAVYAQEYSNAPSQVQANPGAGVSYQANQVGEVYAAGAPAPSGIDTDYRVEFQSAPINADTINNGPINHGQAYDTAAAYGTLFVPGPSADVNAVQQVQRYEVPNNNDGAQVLAEQQQQQVGLLKVSEQAEQAPAQSDEGSTGNVGPSGYYSTNIQY